MATSTGYKVPNVLVVTDIGNDYDDMMALLILGYYHKLGKINLQGVIVTLEPALERAQMAHGLFRSMGINNVEVAVGTEGVVVRRKPTSWTEEALRADFSTTDKKDFRDHKELSLDVLERARENNEKIRFLSLACLRTSWQIVEQDKELFAAVVEEVHCQGGCQWDFERLPEKVIMSRHDAMNNVDDLNAADQFYKFVWDRKIPCVTYEKEAVYESTFSKAIFDPKEASPPMRQVAEYIYKIHDRQKTHYYEVACSDKLFQTFMNRDWFLKGCPGVPQELVDDKNCPAAAILPYTTVIPYDPFAALGCIRDIAGVEVPLGPVQKSKPKEEKKPAEQPAQQPAQRSAIETSVANTPITIEKTARTDTIATAVSTISKTDTWASSASSTSSCMTSPSTSPVNSPKTSLPAGPPTDAATAPTTNPSTAPPKAPANPPTENPPPGKWYDPPSEADWDLDEMKRIATCKFVKKAQAAALANGIKKHMGMALAMQVEEISAGE